MSSGRRNCIGCTGSYRSERAKRRKVSCRPIALSSPEKCFQQAIAIARQQGAKSLELRAVMSLARLWQHQGKNAEAKSLLAEIYGWFTEGFDTRDLREAKALIEELSHQAIEQLKKERIVFSNDSLTR